MGRRWGPANAEYLEKPASDRFPGAALRSNFPASSHFLSLLQCQSCSEPFLPPRIVASLASLRDNTRSPPRNPSHPPDPVPYQQVRNQYRGASLTGRHPHLGAVLHPSTSRAAVFASYRVKDGICYGSKNAHPGPAPPSRPEALPRYSRLPAHPDPTPPLACVLFFFFFLRDPVSTGNWGRANNTSNSRYIGGNRGIQRGKPAP